MKFENWTEFKPITSIELKRFGSILDTEFYNETPLFYATEESVGKNHLFIIHEKDGLSQKLMKYLFWENLDGTFSLRTKTQLKPEHILLDDVLPLKH